MKYKLGILVLIIAYVLGIFCILNVRWCGNSGLAWTISVAIVAGLIGATMLTLFNHNTH